MLTRIGSGALVAALLGAAGTAGAGGFATPVAEPAVAVPVAPAARALDVSGAVWGDWGQVAIDQDDDTDDDGDDLSLDGSALRLGGAVELGFGRFVVGLDVQSFDRDLSRPEGTNFYSWGPEYASAMGLHLGVRFGGLRVGAFQGRNSYQAYDGDAPDSEYRGSGDLRGLEAEYAIADRFRVFGQFGEAEMLADPGDTYFDGSFRRIGASADFGRFGVAADYETGHSDGGFSDGEGDEGDYEAWTLRADYHLTDRFSINASYDHMEVQTDVIDEGNFGEETTLYLGVTFALGGATARPNLVTTTRPGQAATWADVLD